MQGGIWHAYKEEQLVLVRKLLAQPDVTPLSGNAVFSPTLSSEKVTHGCWDRCAVTLFTLLGQCESELRSAIC